MASKDGLERVSVQVTITLNSGERVKGAMKVIRGRNLGDTLNNGQPFILLEGDDGQPIYLALTSIQTVKSSQMPAADQLERGRQAMSDGDPYKVLNLKQGCDRETLQRQYHELAKKYHPDQFTTLPLPDEVLAYLNSMTRRINMAYSELEAELRRREAEELARRAREEQFRPARKFGR